MDGKGGGGIRSRVWWPNIEVSGNCKAKPGTCTQWPDGKTMWLYREKGDVVWVEILGASGRDVGKTGRGGVESQVIYVGGSIAEWFGRRRGGSATAWKRLIMEQNWEDCHEQVEKGNHLKWYNAFPDVAMYLQHEFSSCEEVGWWYLIESTVCHNLHPLA